MDFTFDDYESEPEKHEVVHTIKLKNQHGKTFYEKLTYIYLEMPNFNKRESELKTRLDQWLYFIKHLQDFQSIPEIFKNEIIFNQAFEKAEIAKLGQAELHNYENSLKVYRDLKGVIDTAHEEGKTEGKVEAARILKKRGTPIDIIIEATGLSEEDIQKL